MISTLNGPQQGTVDAIEEAKAAGVREIVAYLSKTDLADDEELFELLEMETRELLSHHGGYDGDSVDIVRGSAKDALGSSGAAIDPKAASMVFSGGCDRSSGLRSRHLAIFLERTTHFS